MSKAMLKIVSLVCSICLIVSVCITQAGFAATEAPADGSGITESDIPSQYQWLTASDFQESGVELGGSYESSDKDFIHNMDKSLDNTVFTAKVNFSGTDDNRIYIGNRWDGIFFNGTAEGIQLCNNKGSLIKLFTEAEAGCQLINNSDLKLTVSFEFLNNDGTNTDLKIGVFFNGKLYQNEYITHTGCKTADLKQMIKLYVQKAGSLTITSVSTPVPNYLDEYTTTTIGLVRGLKNITNAIGRPNVDGTLFGVKVTFDSDGTWLQYGGNGSDWFGVRFQLDGANLKAGCSMTELKDYSGEPTSVTFDPKIAFGDGTETFVGKTFDLHISTEIVNHDGSGELDVRYGFYFNGKLYNGKYFYSYNTANVVGNYVAFQNIIPNFTNTGSISNKEIDKNLTLLSINDITSDTNALNTAYYVLHPEYSRTGRYLEAANFNNTVFGANVTLTNNSKQTFFQIGGNGDWDGFRFKAEGSNLVIEGEAGITSTTITPDFIDAETFNGTPIDIYLSTEIKNLDSGETANDVVYGVYIGGKFYTTLFAYNKADTLSNRVVFNNWDSGSTFAPVEKPNNYKVPGSLTEVSLNDFSIGDGTYSNAVGPIGECTNAKIKDLTEAVFTGYVTFSSVRTTEAGKVDKQSTICYAAQNSAADAMDGIRISNHHQWVPNPEGTLSVSFFGSNHVRLDPKIAGTTLIGEKIKLQVVILPADFDGDENATDALIGIIINDKLYNGTFFKVKDGLENVGKYTRVYSYGSTIDVASPTAQFPSDFITLTPREFGVEGTWKSKPAYGSLKSNYTAANHSGEAMSLMGKTISMDIEYKGSNYIHFALQDEWHGLRVQTADGSIKIESSITGAGDCQSITCTPDLAGVDFTKKFNLKITIEAYNSTDAKIGVWFNDKLYANRYLKWNNVADKLTTVMNILPQADGYITVTSPEVKLPTAEDGYTCKSLTDYGFTYKTYTGNPESKNIEGLSTEKIVVSGKLALTGKAHMVLLGDSSGYYLGMDWAKNSIILKHTDDLFATPIRVPLSNVSTGMFAFDLAQTIIDADNDGEKDDVQLELWVNGNYSRKYFLMDYANNASSEYSRVVPDGGSLTIKRELTNETNEKFPTDLIKRTFVDLGVGNGDTSWSTIINNNDSVVGTVFSGYITLHGKDVWIQYGGKGAGGDDFWKGIRFAFDGTNITLSPSMGEFLGSYVFTPEKAKTQFADTRVLLQITAEKIDIDDDGEMDDVKLGVWFNGALYDNVYLYLVDAVDNLRQNFAIIQKDQKYEDGYATVESWSQRSDKVEKVPTGLTERTFTDYEIADGTTSWSPKVTSGSIVDTLFSAYFEVHGKMWFQYGGKGSEKDDFWKGLRYAFEDQKLYLRSSYGEFKGSYTFTSEKAGVQLYDNLFLLQISVERVDSDNDKKVDDIKLGLFFNGVLYDNTYLYLVDAADKLGNNIAIIQPEQNPDNGRATIKSIKIPVDFTEFGFTKQWKKELNLI